MTNLNTQWKAEWQRRRDFFNREVGKVEKKTQKKPWSAKLWGKYKTNKKKPETELEKLFGAMDQACITMKNAKPDKKIAAINAFLKTIKAAGPKANAFVTKMFIDLNNSAADADMTKQELAEKKKDIQALSKILQNDVDALITSAHAYYLQTKKATNPDGSSSVAGAMGGLKDAKLVKAQLISNIKKGLAWIGKAERNPDARSFNHGIKEVGRDIMAPLGRCSAIWSSRHDEKAIAVATELLGPYGAGKNRVDVDAAPDRIKARLAEAKEVIIQTGRWIQKVKV